MFAAGACAALRHLKASNEERGRRHQARAPRGGPAHPRQPVDEGVQPAAAGRPAYHPSTMLKIYLYGYLNRLQSSRRLEREAQRNIELMWLTGCLAPSYLGGVFIH